MKKPKKQKNVSENQLDVIFLGICLGHFLATSKVVSRKRVTASQVLATGSSSDARIPGNRQGVAKAVLGFGMTGRIFSSVSKRCSH